MSVADTLHDAVAELDGYIAERADDGTGWGEANPSGPHYAELIDVRDRMHALRQKIDGLYALTPAGRADRAPEGGEA